MEAMSRLAFVSFLLVSSMSSSSAYLTLGMEPCPRDADNFNDCVMKMVEVCIAAVTRGESMLDIKHEPANINMTFNFTKEDMLSLHVEGKRKSLLKGVELTAVRNFNFDIDALKMSFTIYVPEMRVDTPCTVKGHFGDRIFYPNEADGITLHTVADVYTGKFEFNFVIKTNSSGKFLVPLLSFYEGNIDGASFRLENVFRMHNPLSVYEMQVWRKLEETGGSLVKDVMKKSLGQLIEQLMLAVMQQNSYDELYPEGLFVRESASTLASSCLGLVIVSSALILQGV